MNVEKLTRIFKNIIIVSAFLGLAAIIMEYGFRVSKDEIKILHYISVAVVFIYVFYQIFLIFTTKPLSRYFKTHKIESFLITLILLELILSIFNLSLVEKFGEFLHVKDIAFLYIVFAQVFFMIGIILGGLRINTKVLQSKIHPSRLFALSFLLTILIGAFLLMLPASTVSGHISFIDALFTSTSSVCVTGLITLDTATYFTTFGKIVIMILFQIGGLGLMTFTTFFSVFLSGGIGIRERILLHDLLDEENIGAITRILSFLTITTFLIELIGAGILYLSIQGQVADKSNAMFLSLFHSISAFCNAGFSLFTMNLMDPLVRSNYLFTTTISVLIILGGIGFPTIMSFINLRNKDIYGNRKNKRINIQTKIILGTTLGLIATGTVFTYFSEAAFSLKGLEGFSKLHAAYFQSVTSRTAGFNTVDFSLLSIPTTIFYIFLMFVGASPGGTGGGIKTTTFLVLLLSIFSIVRSENKVTVGGRTIPREVISRALIKTIMSLSFIFLGIFLLTFFENKNLLDLTFESFSAFGTVGLSRGITGLLSAEGKIIITILMFVGRIGPLSFLFSLMRIKEKPEYDLPEENISTL